MKVTSYLIGFVVSVAIIVGAFLLHDQLAHFRSLGIVGIFLINLVGSATIFLPAPAIATVVGGGALYPPVLVACAAALGGAIGEMTGFLFGTSGQHLFVKKQSIAYKVFKNVFLQYGGLIIVIIAFIPNPFFDVIGIGAGALGYSPKRFFIYLFIGRLLRDLLLAYVGSKI